MLRAFAICAAIMLVGSPAHAVTKTVNGISVSLNLPQAQRGVDYSFQIAPTGQTAPYTFQILGGALPAGFTMSSSGLVTGVNCVSSNGSFNVDVRITSANNVVADFVGNQALSINMTSGPGGACSLTLGSSIPNGTVGTAYSGLISNNSTDPPVSYSLAGGTSLPPGLSLNSSTGGITGTPTTAGTYTFSVRATDSIGKGGIATYTITIAAPVTISVSPPSLANPVNGTAYSQAVSASGGTAPYAFALSGGSLPTGLALNTSTGAIAGTPTATGTFSFTVTATDSNSVSGSKAYTLTVQPGAVLVLNPTTLPNGTNGTAYSQTVTGSGGSAAGYTYTVSAGALPTGLTLNTATGAISGTPTAAGNYNFTIATSDSVGNTGSRAYTVGIAPGAVLTINPSALPDSVNGSAYSQSVSAIGGTGTGYTYAVSIGALPSGILLDSSSGAITGTPTAAGTYSFTIRATDSAGNTGTRAYTITVAPGAILSISPALLPSATNGSSYSQIVTATGGTGSGYVYSVTAGALPLGLSLNASTGAITGSPTAAGTYTFTIGGSDSAGNTGTQSYTIQVQPGAILSLSPSALPDAINGSTYSQGVTVSGGTGAYSFAISLGSLPTGLTLDANTGAISGTPGMAATYSFTVQATDSDGNTGTRAYSLTVQPGTVLTISPPSLAAGTIGSVYSQLVSATGGTGAGYNFSIVTGALPVGLSLDPSTGGITGTPGASGTFTFDVKATDNAGNNGLRSYSVAIAPAPVIITLSPSALPNATNGTGYDHTVSASGGSGPYSLAILSGALPAGLTLNAGTGEIAGTPTSAGAFNFTIEATDANGATASQIYTIQVLPGAVLGINPTSLPNATNGTTYSQTVAANGGTGSGYTYAVASGTLPAGLNIDAATGAITGTPTSAGNYSFTIGVTDGAGNSGSQSYTVAVTPGAILSLSPSSLSAGTNGSVYSQSVTASGGTGSGYLYSVISGSLPTGLTLDAAMGAITGTPSAAGTYNFTIGVTDSAANTGSHAYTLAVTPAAVLTLSPVSLPSATNGSSYSQVVTGSGGTAPYSFAISLGSLPAGLTLDTATGAITGTPSAAGTYNFTVGVTDAAGNTGSHSYTLAVAPGAILAVSPSGLSNATNGTAYSAIISAAGGAGTYSFAIASGSLPPGLTLDATSGGIAGTPTAAGNFSFTVQASDSSGNTGVHAYSLTVAPGAILSVGPASLPDALDGSGYSETVTASGGTGSYSYAVSGSLPAGLTLEAATGAITGAPTAAGTYSFTIAATDSVGNTGSRTYSVVVQPGAVLSVSPSSLANATNGSVYNQAINASGGTGSGYSYTLGSGALPTGLSLDSSSGAITGTPTTTGAFSFTLAVADSAGNTGSRSYTIQVQPGAVLAMTPSSLPNGTNGTAYTQTISASGGSGTGLSYTVSSGTLPLALSLDASSGAITGTPAAAGTYNFTIGVTDSVGNTGSQSYTLVVAPGAVLAVSPAALSDGTNGMAYGATIGATGGTGPYGFAVASGTLPPGLVLDANSGTITGTPTAAGTYSFTITVTDSVGDTGNRSYSVVVQPGAVLTVSPPTLPSATNGSSYSQSLSASGGAGAGYTYSLSSGALPPGLALNTATGAITGTPIAAGTYNFAIVVTDSAGNTGSHSYSVAVQPGAVLSITPSSLPNGTNGTAYAQTASATGGSGTGFSYTVASGTLPTGLGLGGSTGAITGTPTAAGTYSFIIAVTDSAGNSGSQSYSVVVQPSTVLTLSPSSLTNGTNGTPYAQTVSASGGTGSGYSYTLGSGALPTGLSLDASSGAITGTPSTAGTFSFTIAVADGAGNTGSQSYTIQVQPGATLSLGPTALGNAVNGAAYNQPVTASGGTGPYSYTLAAGSLPPGISVDPNTGVITGTPVGPGTYNFTIEATDAVGNTGTRSYTITVQPGAVLTVSPSSLPDATFGSAYAQVVTASGGSGSGYSYALTSGTLAAGLSLNQTTGAISGSPTALGTFNFTIGATDSEGNTGSKSYSMQVSAGAILIITPSSLANATNGTAYSQTVAASGGSGNGYAYIISSGALPAGLGLDRTTGTISGTPTATGTFTFTLAATDSVGNSGNHSYTIEVQPGAVLAMSPSSLPNGTNGTAYAQTISASGGSGTGFSYTVVGGSLPSGLNLDASTGAITGTPAAAGTYNFTIGVRDSAGNIGSQRYSVVVQPGAVLTVAPSALPNPTNGTAYSQPVSATGGSGTGYTFAVSAGSLPRGLNLDPATGMIGGTPRATGTATFTVMATDSLRNTGTRSYSLTVKPGAILAVSPASLPNPVNGSAYSQKLEASGGTAPYSFSLSRGSLPPGLSIEPSTGTIAGTPSATGIFSFTVLASDAAGNTGSRSYTISVQPGAILAVDPETLPSATNGTAYNQKVTATGGSGSGYTFAVAEGALPPGLSLDRTTGAITGNPSVAGTFKLTIGGTDSDGNTGSRSYSVIVQPKPVAVTGTTLTINLSNSPGASASVDLSTLLTSSDPTSGPVTFAVAARPANGTVQLLGTTLTYTATKGAVGDSLQFVAMQGGVRSSPATILIYVTRASLADDPVLAKMTDAQLGGAARAGITQMNNVAGHLEGAMWDNPCAFSARISARNARGVNSENPVADPSAPKGQCAKASRFNGWAAGSITVDDENGRISSDGMTAGIETHPVSNTIVGIAAGAGHSRNELDDQNRVVTSSRSISLYGAWRPRDRLQLSSALGYADVDSDSRRLLGMTTRAGQLSRDGRVLFGYFGAAGDLPVGTAILSSYARASLLDIRLHGASENPTDPLSVRYGSVSQTQFEGTFGATLRRPIPLGASVLTPFARVEHRWRNLGSYQERLGYADTLGGDEMLSRSSEGHENWVLGAGARWLVGPAQLMLEYETSGESVSSVDGGVIRLQAGVDF